MVAMVVFTILASLAQMVAPAMVSKMIDLIGDDKETLNHGVDVKTLIALNGIKNPNFILPGQPIIY